MALNAARAAAEAPSQARRFYVHDRAAGRNSGHRVDDAADFHEAAVLFAESWVPVETGELAVMVTDCDSGEAQCFLVDLGENDARPC